MIVNPDILIIGGGVVGTACARTLALAGRRVRLVERSEAPRGEAWRAAAGLLAPQVEAREEDPLFELGLASREAYGEIAEALVETTGVDPALRQCGILQIANGELGADALRAKVAWQRQQGHLADWLDAREVQERWPWVGRTDGALWAPRDGSIDPARLVEALRADCTRLGVEVVQDEIHALSRDRDRVTGATGLHRHQAGAVVVAAGAWSGRIDQLPRPVSVEPVRGQIVAFPWPAKATPGIVYGHGGYLLERDGQALCGSTQEHAGFNPDTTDDGRHLLTERARSLVPALASAEPVRHWAGLRPGTPDGLPIIGREPNAKGLWYATGHGRSGVLLAAVTASILANQMAGEPTVEEAHAVRPERFWS